MNRTIVITGATRGLGLELARKFIKAGDKVFGISRTREHWTAARKSIGSGNFLLFCGDITSEKKVKELLGKIVRDAGRIDILINNAGITADAPRAAGPDSACPSLADPCSPAPPSRRAAASG